jgi:hypothetical protein
MNNIKLAATASCHSFYITLTFFLAKIMVMVVGNAKQTQGEEPEGCCESRPFILFLSLTSV